MNPTLCSACGILVIAAALPLLRGAATPATSAPAVAPRVSDAGCKPTAPIRVTLRPRDLVGGRARVDYDLETVVDALDVEVAIELPYGGSLRSHATPPRGAWPRGSRLAGSAFVELPARAEVDVSARIHVPDPDAPGGVGVYTTTRRVTWGEVDPVPDDVTPVRSGDELTLDVPATRQ